MPVPECIQRTHCMTETLSVRIDAEIRKRLDALAKQSRRSKSFLAAEAIAAYVQAEEWQLGEIESGIKELDAGSGIAHEAVAEWLGSWGKSNAKKPPR
jgi:RHH-type rel operon transcriptional repressor/antitoxin RelB